MKSFLRFLLRNPLYTLINVVGLAVSLMFAILLGDYTWRQFSIDSHHRHADRIAALGSDRNLFTWHDASQELGRMLPEVERTCCVLAQGGAIKAGEHRLAVSDDMASLSTPNMLLVDPTFFSLFDHDFVAGDSHAPLARPDQCVLTESAAHSLFPNGGAVGQSVQVVGKRNIFIGDADPYDSTLVYTVSAVIRDLDKTILPNTTKIILNYKRQPQVCGYAATNDVYAYSGYGYTRTFFLLRPGASLQGKQGVIKDYINSHVRMTAMSPWGQTTLTPLRQLMFSPLNDGMGLLKGDRGRLNILLAVVLAILLFAVTNYVNLTVANTGFRAKEMATRRLLGSSGRSIALQLMAESTLMVLVSFGIGLLLALAFEADMATLFRGKIALSGDVGVGSVGVAALFVVALGALSGIVPSWQMSRYKPIDVVRGSFRYHSKMVLGRVFMVLQGVVTVTLLAAVLVIYLQVHHLVNAPLGFNFKNVFVVSPENTQAMRAELDATPFVRRVGTFSGTILAGNTNSLSTIRVTRGGKTEDVSFYRMRLDSAAMGIYGLRLARDYGPTEGGYYANETGERLLGLHGGQGTFRLDEADCQLSGVVRDFHTTNILNAVSPFILQLSPASAIDYPSYLVETDGTPEAKQRLQEVVRRVDKTDKDMVWKVDDLQEDVARSFDDHTNTLHIVALFALVAVVISTLGYVGMSVFFIRQRRKEVGIRKIMGCPTGRITASLLRRFCMPLAVAYVVAIPVSWYMMAHWLHDFDYRLSLAPWMFLLVVAVSLLQAVLSVLVQTLRAAHANPAETIKTE